MAAAASPDQDCKHVWKLLRLGGESAGAGIQKQRPVGTFKSSANGRATLLCGPTRVAASRRAESDGPAEFSTYIFGRCSQGGDAFSTENDSFSESHLIIAMASQNKALQTEKVHIRPRQKV